MNIKRIFLIVSFLVISYLFIIKFSKEEHEELIAALQLQKYVECPTGIRLYRLKSGSFLYRIQVQSRLPHDPSITFRILKRCETYMLDSTEKKSNYAVDDYATDGSQLDPNDYDLVGGSLTYLVEEACRKLDYKTEECEPSSNGSGLVSRIVASHPLVAYMLEVVKGPDNLHTVPAGNVPTEWSFQTLIRGIFPGTLWCGFGNMADDTFGQLGELFTQICYNANCRKEDISTFWRCPQRNTRDDSEADECCRSHDLCKPIIKAFQTRYYFSNPSLVPISHCGCDMQFYNCLRKVDSQTSNTIGKIFFNIVKMKCFDFDVRKVCTSSFLGLCIKYSNKCVAILKNNKIYRT